MPVTLFLTRMPLNSFLHPSVGIKGELKGKPINQSGRWGELVVIKGPIVNAAQMRLCTGGAPANTAASVTNVPATNGVINITSNGAAITDTKSYTTMERFLPDVLRQSNVTPHPKDGFVQMHPRATPYWITYEAHNSKVKELPSDEKRCFRVNGGTRTGEGGVLIHSAPHIGWVDGCISPRPLGDFTIEYPPLTNPSSDAIGELIEFVGISNPANLFVLDW